MEQKANFNFRGMSRADIPLTAIVKAESYSGVPKETILRRKARPWLCMRRELFKEFLSDPSAYGKTVIRESIPSLGLVRLVLVLICE